MKDSIVAFFDNMPPRQCTKCGSYMEEQADCYLSICTECQDPIVMPLKLTVVLKTA